MEVSCAWAPQGHRQGCGRLHRQNLCHDLTRGPRSVGAAMLSSRKTAPAKHQDLYMPRRRPSLVQPRRGECRLQTARFNVEQGPTAVEHAQHLRKTWYVAQVRCCATLVQILLVLQNCCTTVAPLCTAATSIALTYTIIDLMVQHTTLHRFVYWCLRILLQQRGHIL